MISDEVVNRPCAPPAAGAEGHGDWREVAHLLELAQAGGAAQARQRAEELLSAATGSVADGPAALHFPRAIAMLMEGDHRAAIAACGVMLQAAQRDRAPGWHAIAMATRAGIRLSLGELEPAESDYEAVLRDLVDAESVMGQGVSDPYVAGNAHTGIAIPYEQMRLYELALPHHEAAYEHSLRDTTASSGGPAMWQCNLAKFHLSWALELYRVGLDEEAESHSHQAREHGERAMAIACGDHAGAWHLHGRLLTALAQADGPQPGAIVDEIKEAFRLQVALGVRPDPMVFPFLAVALSRSGRSEEALAALEEGLEVLEANPGETPWLMRAALTHTRAVLLAKSGSAEVRATLEYGNELAAALWRQRERTLQNTQTLQRFESLRMEHDAVTLSAQTDPLTKVANRRGFDRQLEALQSQPGLPRIGVLIVDMDKFKEINDTLGHRQGDEALRQLAATLAGQARDVDVVARLGGDEFGILLPGASAEAARLVGNRILQAVRAAGDCLASVSIGAASGHPSALPELLEQADQAMYRAKRAGGDGLASSPTGGW